MSYPDPDTAAKQILNEAASGFGLKVVEMPATVHWPRPMEPEAFTGLAGDFVRLVEPETEADRVALLANFLVASGVLFGREAWAEADAAIHYPVEYAMIVGPSGAGRKGTASKRVLPVMEATEEGFMKHVLGGLSSGEGLIKGISPKDGELTDTVRRYLVLLPELASLLGVMKREGNTMSAILREAWDGGRLQVLTRKDPLAVENVNLSVMAHITQGELLNNLTAIDRVNGFANRFLVLCVKRSQLLPEGGKRPNSTEIVRRLHHALEKAKGRGRVQRNDAARALWADEYPRLTAEREGIKGALCGRAEAHVLRVSLLYGLLDSAAEIRAEHLRAALAFWRYCESSIEFIFNAGQSGAPDADKIMKAVRTEPQALTELHRVFGNNRSSEWLLAKLAFLVRAGKIEQVSRQGERSEIVAWLKKDDSPSTRPKNEG
jgi:hypothetical protein